MTSFLNITIAQLNFHVGDIFGNAQRVLDAVTEAQRDGSPDLIIFPELALTGYPPEDLLLRPSLKTRVDLALGELKENIKGVDVLLGCPYEIDGRLYNCALLIREGEVAATYKKQHLPNYQVFDEVRYFTPGQEVQIIEIKGIPVGVTICEDIWFAAPVQDAKAAGAKLILNLNASPFHTNKVEERQLTLKTRVSESGLPIVYANLVGGQDELVFDGSSMVIDGLGDIRFHAPAFEEGLYPVIFEWNGKSLELQDETLPESVMPSSLEARVYDALVMGLREYVNKNGFPGIVIGLSGGIDSGLSLAIAVDALGADKVEAVMMPFHYTASMSIEDAEAEARLLGVRYRNIPIHGIYDAYMSALKEPFDGTTPDTSEENLQSRCRGVLLMAISNKHGYMVLTTGNKSEMAVGYATLYGDMVGGYNALKDVPKTLVYKLSNYRNSLSDGPVIPQRVIDRPASAELAPDQVDEDSLPPYADLDRILELYVEQDCSAETIIAEGFSRDVVNRVLRLVDMNEYKRNQAPIGVRVTKRGFGKDRRYPLTCHWPAGR